MTDQIKRGRPYMKNYGISAEPTGLMTWEWVDQQMAQARNYWICSTRPDGRPHAAPVWGVWIDGALYFSSDDRSRKARNIHHNPEIVVHLESGDDTVILEGRTVISSDMALLQPVIERYAAKYQMNAADLPVGEYFILRPHTAFAWLESDFPTTATRWDFES